MESSSHGSESIHTTTPPVPLTQSTDDYDLPPPSSSELGDSENSSSIEYSSIEILSSETERNDEERGRVASEEPETQFAAAIEQIVDRSTTLELAESAAFTASTDEFVHLEKEAATTPADGTISTTTTKDETAPSESSSNASLNPLAASFIPSFESSVEHLLSGPEKEDDDDDVDVKEDSGPAEKAEEKGGGGEASAEADPVQKEAAEIKDDILISQTVEILEPVLKDSRSRGESPALDVEDLEDDEKETKELTNDDIADDDAEDATGGGDEKDGGKNDEKYEEGEGDVGAELMSMPSEVRASADSLLTTGTESPVIVSPPHSDDDGRTPKTSQGSEADNSSGFEMISSGERSPVEEAPALFPTVDTAESSEEETVTEVPPTVVAAEPRIEVVIEAETPVVVVAETPVVATSEAPIEAAIETPVEAASAAVVEATTMTTTTITDAAVEETSVSAVGEASVAVEASIAGAAEVPADPVLEDVAGTNVEATVVAPIPAADAVEAPVPATVETPLAATVEAPVAAEVEAPVAVAVEAPVAVAVEAAVTATVDVDAVEESVGAVVEAPVAAVVEAPVAAAVEAPVAAAVEEPIAAVVEEPVAAVVEEPVAVAAEAVAAANEPVAAVIEESVATAVEAPVAPAVEAPVEVPVTAAIEELVAAATVETPAATTTEPAVPEALVGEPAAAAAVETENKDSKEAKGELLEAEWEDILGSGSLMKKTVIEVEKGERPTVGQVVTIMTEGKLEDGTQIDLNERLEFTIGDHDVIQAFEVIARLLRVGEVAEVKTEPKFAYGKLGRAPAVPPEARIHYVIALLEINPPLEYGSMPSSKRLSHGLTKKERGNVLFKREEYSQAIVSYTKAVKILDAESGGSDASSPSALQKLLDEKMKVYNNLAATQMKLLAYDQAIKSCDAVIKLQPNNVKAIFRKGQALESKGNSAEALTYFKRSLKLDPNSKRIKQDVDRLSKLQKKQEDKEKKLYAKMLGTSDAPKQETKKESVIGPWVTWFGSWAIAVAGTAALVGITVVAVKSLS